MHYVFLYRCHYKRCHDTLRGWQCHSGLDTLFNSLSGRPLLDKRQSSKISSSRICCASPVALNQITYRNPAVLAASRVVLMDYEHFVPGREPRSSSRPQERKKTFRNSGTYVQRQIDHKFRDLRSIWRGFMTTSPHGHPHWKTMLTTCTKSSKAVTDIGLR